MADGQDNVVVLNVVTRLDIPAERVLRAALEAGLEKVVLCGYDAEGNEYFASAIANAANAKWLLDRHALKLLQLGDGE